MYDDFSFFTHLFNFYSKCISFPYTEMGLELQHNFRQMEITCSDELEEQLAAHALDILNYFQGEEMSGLQAEYTRMLSHVEGEEALVPINFTAYGEAHVTEKILDDIYESTFDITYDEAPDSMINLLDYYAGIAESEDLGSALNALAAVLAPFSNTLYTHTMLNFYKEVSKGLSEMSEIFSETE